jgi:transposase
MAASARVADHLPVAAVYARLRAAAGHWRRQKWLVIYTALADPRPLDAIARQLGVSPSFTYQALAAYNRRGPAAFDTPGKGGRRRCYLRLDDERAFLDQFIERARAGQVAAARQVRRAQVRRALEGRLGHPVHHATVYRLLGRHGWRKLAPRPAHPQADPAAQAEFKTASPPRSRR